MPEHHFRGPWQQQQARQRHGPPDSHQRPPRNQHPQYGQPPPQGPQSRPPPYFPSSHPPSQAHASLRSSHPLTHNSSPHPSAQGPRPSPRLQFHEQPPPNATAPSFSSPVCVPKGPPPVKPYPTSDHSSHHNFQAAQRQPLRAEQRLVAPPDLPPNHNQYRPPPPVNTSMPPPPLRMPPPLSGPPPRMDMPPPMYMPPPRPMGAPDVMAQPQNSLTGRQAQQNSMTNMPRDMSQPPPSFQQVDTNLAAESVPEKQASEAAVTSNTDEWDHMASWIQDWVTRNDFHSRKKESIKSEKTVKIVEARRMFYELIMLTNNQETFLQQLKQSSSNHSTAAVQHNLQEAKRIQMKMSSIRKQLDGDTVRALCKKVNKAKCKRHRLQRKNQDIHERSRDAAAESVKRHQQIDKWREEILQKTAEKKMEAEMKASADRSLAEVRRKIQDAQQMSDMLAALPKLRALRRDNAKRKGKDVPIQNDLRFESCVSDLAEIVSERLKVYNNELRTLQAMLDIEHEETRERDREKLRQKAEASRRMQDEHLQHWLFGVTDPELHSGTRTVTDQEDAVQQYYNYSQHSLQALVNVREQWDRYLTSNTMKGSALPQGWVQPTPPSSKYWAAVVK